MLDQTGSDTGAAVAGGLEPLYSDKPDFYFEQARDDIVQMLPANSRAAILELGCGSGGTGKAALAAGKAGEYVGIEISPEAAARAARHLSQVLVGDVATVDLAPLAGRFDVLIASEVLEHLVDPWDVLARLATCLRPGALVYASSPNIAHWWVLKELLAGRFDYQDNGALDRTHLRWFTPDTFRQMFLDAGFAVDSVQPHGPIGWKGRLLRRLIGRRYSHLFSGEVMLVGHLKEAAR